MNACGDGILLGMANTVVIGVCLSISTHEPMAQVLLAIIVVGFIPASIIGMIEGWLASTLSTRPPWIRIAVLTLLPLGFVLFIGNACEIMQYAVGACIPTLVAVLVLERSTRAAQILPRASIA